MRQVVWQTGSSSKEKKRKKHIGACTSPLTVIRVPTTAPLCSSLQMAMISFTSMPGTKAASESNVQELQVAREAYELGCLISIASEDIEGFERHFALVKSCYTDYAGVLPASENQHQLQGLNLLGLLAQSKIGEFHTGSISQMLALDSRPAVACLPCNCQRMPHMSHNGRHVVLSLAHSGSAELELIPVDLRENKYIKFPIQLEQYLMEGTYRKVEEVKNKHPTIFDNRKFFRFRKRACKRICSRASMQAKRRRLPTPG